MSRRKQAKPRAFLKLGESGDCEEGQSQQQQQQQEPQSIDLVDPKEEILSDNENDDDGEQSCDEVVNDTNDTNDTNDDNDNEDACQEQKAKDKQQQQHHPPYETENVANAIKDNKNSNRNHSNNSSRSIADIPSNGIKDNALESSASANSCTVAELREFRHDAAAAIADTNGKDCHINPLGLHTADEVEEIDEDLQHTANEDDIDDDDVDYDDEDEDLHSLDSYYSDMYSTHTSSSYSPSISDGTMTPNSMHLHQHHLHQQQHHMQHPHAQLPHLPTQQYTEEEGARTRRQRGGSITENYHNANGNTTTTTGTEKNDEEYDDAENSNAPVEDADNVDQKQNEVSSACLNGTNAGGGEQRQHHHRYRLGRCRSTVGLDGHTIKLPNKLRKADRDSSSASAAGGVAGKFDKLTSDGIKSAADGSYQCQFCDKSFPRLGYLKKHEQSHAEHLPFKCDYCARLFKHKRSRDRHTKLHTGDRRYRCPHCEAAFSRSDHLKIHMKTHDNQKPFQCTICNRGYNTAAALTSHMQNHKKQAAIIAAGGNPQAINYSPRSTGSASSNGSLQKRRYALAAASDSSPSRLEYPKRLRSNFLNCTYCTKNDFTSLEQLNGHIQTMHEKELTSTTPGTAAQTPTNNTGAELAAFQLNCEYCTMKFPNIPSMFQHMRTTHIDRLTSPNSYFEHFNRLAATGTFSPRLIATPKTTMQRTADEPTNIKQEQNLSPKSCHETKQEEPTDLSQNKRRSVTPISPQQHSSPRTPEKPPPGLFFCNQCNAGLPDFESFRNHLKTHIAQGLNLVCHHCGLALREQSEYERHVISHFLISNSEFNCAANCSKSYGKPEELQKHLLDAHVTTMYKCTLCAELFETKVAIQVHFACTHSQETKILRCSACMEVFRTEQDFNVHVKTRHQTVNGAAQNTSTSLQCMFCRTVCSSDLEMHFHLAAHARQFRCPSCPETFHVEFLLDRHMQSHHGGMEQRPTPHMLPTPPNKDSNNFEEHAAVANNNNNQLSPMNSLYVNALFGKSPLMPLAAAAAQQNNNNSILDYNVAFAAAHLNKGLFPAAAAAAAATAGKFYSPLQVDTGPIKHPALMYGLGQRYFDTNRTLIDMYNQQHHQQDKVNPIPPSAGSYFISPKGAAQENSAAGNNSSNSCKTPSEANVLPGFSCGMCERNDFRTDAELHSHRKIVHNIKTGVSLRCAYCSGNFKSRSELEHHMKTCHNSTGKHKCLICDEIFPSPAILAEHKLQHSKVGQSGKCSHCAKPLNDVAAFKGHLAEHNTEGQTPVQCICCRQSLHSDFEIGLHAKFHTKSSNVPETVCALCLEPIPNATNEAKVCEKCCRKHNLNNKFNKQRENYDARPPMPCEPRTHYIENRCNLCKMILPHPQKLQEHLVEHTFAGCEDRGFNCYICSAVFTAPAGLLNHMNEHGQNARPYDCNLCTEKYFFRAELDHHLVDHELREHVMKEIISQTPENKEPPSRETPRTEMKAENNENCLNAAVKKEIFEEQNKAELLANEEDDEYIEVEKVPELGQTKDHTETEIENEPQQHADETN